MKKLGNQIIITGANGFVAKNVRKLLNQKNIPFISIARKNYTSYKDEKKVITKNIDEKLYSNLKNCDTLIHLIGTGRQTINEDYHTVNVSITRNVINICKKTKINKIVYISGLGVSKKSTLGYFISKFKAEKEIINSGLDYTILRASYIIGKDDPLSKKLRTQIKNGLITIPGSGNYYLQPIFVNDVAKVIFKAITSKKFSRKILDLVGPEIVSFKEFVRIFNNNKVKIEHESLEKTYSEAIHNQNSNYGVDDLGILIGGFTGNHTKLQKLCGFKFTSFKKVLETSSLP